MTSSLMTSESHFFLYSVSSWQQREAESEPRNPQRCCGTTTSPAPRPVELQTPGLCYGLSRVGVGRAEGCHSPFLLPTPWQQGSTHLDVEELPGSHVRVRPEHCSKENAFSHGKMQVLQPRNQPSLLISLHQGRRWGWDPPQGL